MIAARFLGLPAIGLQAVAHAELGVAISKDSQKDDWSVRPLSPRQEAYALADVQHLLALHAGLEAKLKDAGRFEWVLEESAAVAALPAARRERDPEAWQSVKGARKLKPRALAVLREVYGWREQRAEAKDVPSFKVFGTEPLLEPWPRRRPPRRPSCDRFAAFPPGFARTRPICSLAIARGLSLPEAALPRLPKAPPRPVVTDAQKRHEAALRLWRAEEAKRAALDVSVILPQRLIDRLAEAAPADLDALARVEGLRQWRREAFGPGVLAALRVTS